MKFDSHDKLINSLYAKKMASWKKGWNYWIIKNINLFYKLIEIPSTQDLHLFIE